MSAQRKVALVGFWPTTKDIPFVDPHWKGATIFSLNHNHPYLPTPESWDLWMDIHDPKWSATTGLKPEVWADQERFLKIAHGKPIYMQQYYPEYPDSVAYPLAEVVATHGRRYFTSAMAYMVALILHQHVHGETVSEIGVFGADMRGNEEYATQRPAFEYWLGRAEGLGIKVYVPPQAGVLNPDGLDYGYDEDNSAWVEMRRALEARILQATAERESALVAAAKAQGRQELLHGMLSATPPPAAAERAALEAHLAEASRTFDAAMANHYGHEGILQDNREWLRRIDERRRGGGAL